MTPLLTVAENCSTSGDTPFLRVPNELISILFIHCLPSNPSYNEQPAEEILRDQRLAPLAIASVCRAWRHIACSTPELWSSCWVNYINPEANTIWLERAGTLTLHLYGKHYRFPTEWIDCEPLISSIFRFQRRWKSLQLDTLRWASVGFVPNFNTPALEKLDVPAIGHMDGWLKKLLQNAPQLRELKLGSLNLTRCIELPCLPNLWTLTLGYITQRQAILILSAFSQLQKFDAFIREDPPTPSDLPVVTLNDLVTLQVYSSSELSLIFDNLTLPSLRVLRTSSRFTSNKFLSFVHRSRCRITELRLNCYEVPTEAVIAILHDSAVGSWIEELHLTENRYSEPDPDASNGARLDILRLLHHGQLNQHLPHLNKLSFFNCPFTDVPDGLLADVIISRCNNPLLCRCADCLSGSQARKIQLNYVNIGYLSRKRHSLDIARLIPLPGDGRVGIDEATTVLELSQLEGDLLWGGGKLYHVKVWIG